MTINLKQLATQTMRERGLEPDFSQEVLHEISEMQGPAPWPAQAVDLRHLLWCSIDNDDSKDLDQLTYAEKGDNKSMTLWIAVADVDALVKKNSAIDSHARLNTTSVYTPAKIFPMLPEKLSTDLTSLNENEDRVAMIVKIEVDAQGQATSSSIFQGIVNNHAQLAYSSVGKWLEGNSLPPEKIKNIKGLEDSLRLQNEAAQLLRTKRHETGSLTLESSEAEVKIADDQTVIELPPHNLAHQLIEEFMIAANTSTAQHLNEAHLPSLRRVVRIPKYWKRIVDIAKGMGESLPAQPDPKALDKFLILRKKTDPETFPDLSLTVIKLLGRGEYIVENDPDHSVGHFALGLSRYTHSTAPNRRFPDLIAQRQYKAFLLGEKIPYSLEELSQLADHCTQQEDAATKVQRQMNKSAAALFLSSEIGAVFEGIVTGASEKGTWVRIFHPAVEGRVIEGFKHLEIGDKITVKLAHVNIERGFIDFNLKTAVQHGQ